MFDKVLIANRGAIAVRIQRTLRRLGVRSVAVYAEADADSLHVRNADEAYSLGEGPAADTYLNVERLLDIAAQSGAKAIHPGYGFLSENPGFVERCEAAGIAFAGPTPEQMRDFGLKHRARALAQQAGVPLLPGSELLRDEAAALGMANQIGYPVMVKATAGGGGIGMQLCHDADELSAAFAKVKRLGASHFADDGVFIEKFIPWARHIEVQVFGDGQGHALALGERDCSSQRRNQKVVEECPAPNLSSGTRHALHSTAERLLASVGYRNAGTVEFIVDQSSEAFYFLEVNTRLQVEHGVTEEVYGVDLVEWMLRLAAGERIDLDEHRIGLLPHGHAIQVRLYAEDPYRDFQPSAGMLTHVDWPAPREGLRIDHWIEAGIEVSPWFDPMLAKVIVHGENRDDALAHLQRTLDETHIYGGETNLPYLRELVRDPVLAAGQVTTRYLNDFKPVPARIDVIQGGTQTTVQDALGRRGYWHVGVPPSGPFDGYSPRLGNRLLGNDEDDAGLEITLQGPSLQFSQATQIVLCGSAIEARIDAKPVPLWQVVEIPAGATLHLGRIRDAGARAYLCVAGGIQCPRYLGSRSTFTLGQFGGHNGRALRAGDVLHLGETEQRTMGEVPETLRPAIGNHWELRVIYGPHGAPDFFTPADIETFFSTDWEVHYNSSRTGIRLIGPKPQWARPDGGEAGMHPSNIHDNAYAFGSVDFTGDMPVILGPDGPSLGGFVCPATVIHADLWKLGQLRAGDKIRFLGVDLPTALRLEEAQIRAIDTLAPADTEIAGFAAADLPSPVLKTLDAGRYGERIVYRAAGDHFLLVEYGPLELDIRLRFRAHALMGWLERNAPPGLKELTPGIRSLQVHFDPKRLSHNDLLAHLEKGEAELAQELDTLEVPSRIVHLPLSWDDPACRLAIEKYMQSVRKDAPWCPSNLEFIRRINGLPDIDAVKRVLFEATYLVMGLGDVYLGAPVATPIDPRHRLVTTKYNPARTWTAENSVGIGGSYLCVYGMEGPGGYQFVGRTLQMWNRYRKTAEFPLPWLLRFFDQIRFYEVSADELQRIRRDFPQGRYPLRIEETQFRLADYQHFVTENQTDIQQFTRQRQKAFDEELARWHASGQFNFAHTEAESDQGATADWPEDSVVIDSPVSGSVWQSKVSVGDRVSSGDTLLVLESMKMEIAVTASVNGRVTRLLKSEGGQVRAGDPLVVLEEM
ncbi:MAG: urea carboxylase [Chromatiales bacterium]|nr:urea carboxylase [Chromatiales bacterium]